MKKQAVDARISVLLILAFSLFLYNLLKPGLVSRIDSLQKTPVLVLENSGLTLKTGITGNFSNYSGSKDCQYAPFFFNPIPVNFASVAMLTTIPGVGEVLAQSIVQKREKDGLFSSPSDLLRVSGIGKKRMTRLSKLVSFEK